MGSMTWMILLIVPLLHGNFVWGNQASQENEVKVAPGKKLIHSEVDHPELEVKCRQVGEALAHVNHLPKLKATNHSVFLMECKSTLGHVANLKSGGLLARCVAFNRTLLALHDRLGTYCGAAGAEVERLVEQDIIRDPAHLIRVKRQDASTPGDEATTEGAMNINASLGLMMVCLANLAALLVVVSSGH